MPHIVVEYSANLPDKHWDIEQVLPLLVDAAVETGLFPRSGVRARAVSCEHFVVGDGNPSNGFLNVSMRVGKGRTPEDRHTAGEAVFGALKTALKELTDARPVALSFEMRELDDVKFNFRTN